MFKSFAILFLMGMGHITVSAGLDDLEDINFPLNSSVVVDGFQGLELLAVMMARHDNLDLEVLGHTDSLGTAEYNKGLSLRRANSVKAYLVSKGAAEGKIKTAGEGIDRTFDNATREGRFQNRRTSLTLYETEAGVRTKVSYKRLIELFCGELPEQQVKVLQNNEEVMQKLTDLQNQFKGLQDALNKRIDNAAQMDARFKDMEENLPARVAAHLRLGQFTGVSVGLGADDDDFAGQVRGLYFRPIGESFALQVQSDYSHYDLRKEGQLDVGGVYKKGGFQIAAAGSYKWASLEGLDTARIGQGAILADWLFDMGRIGVFGTVPFADGDIVATTPLGTSSAFVQEAYVHVPSQVGLNFGFSIGNRIDIGGHVSSIDAVTDADLGAALELDVLIKDELAWYLKAELNESLLENGDDNNRYLTGLRFGSWNKARYSVSDQLTPVNIPAIRYEILTRTARRGNTAPIAVAGETRVNVPAGTVTLDGSASSDPEGDAITFKWIQTNGPTLVLSDANQAVTSFEGKAGESYNFQLVVRDNFGETGSDSVGIAMEAAPIPVPTINGFNVSPSTIEEGELASLTWNTSDATEVSISGIGLVGPSGTLLVSPDETTEYTLTATNPSGTATQSVTLTVNPIVIPPLPDPVIDFFSAIPDEILQGEFTTLSWGTRFAETVTISALGQVGPAGSLVLAPTTTTTYTLTATNSEGSVSQDVTVTVIPVEPPNNPPVAHAGADQVLRSPGMVTLDGSGSTDPDGDPLSYQWEQVGGLTVALSGADTANPTFMASRGGQLVFRLTVSDGRGGIDTDEVRVSVTPFKTVNQ